LKKSCMILALVLLVCFMVSCKDKEAMAELEKFRAQTVLEEQNKEIVKRFFEEMNKGNIEIMNELLAPEYGFYSPSFNPKPMSREETIEFIKMAFRAFPDLNWRIEKLFVVGDTAIIWNVATGTHQGEFQGIPAAGNKTEVSSILLWTIKDGKVVEEREEANWLGMMEQLGMELKPKEMKK